MSIELNFKRKPVAPESELTPGINPQNPPIEKLEEDDESEAPAVKLKGIS